MRLNVILFLLLGTSISQAQEATITPLEGALWKGFLSLQVRGDQFTQYMTTHAMEDGKPELVKEKGQMNLDLSIDIELQIDAVGDSHILVRETFKGAYSLTRLKRHQIKEERVKGGVASQSLVQVSQTFQYDVPFSDQSVLDQNDAGDKIRITPSGQLDKKGSLKIEGSFDLNFDGEGKFYETRERQPPSTRDPNTRKTAALKKTYTLPVSFEMNVALAGKPVTGEVQVKSEPKSPFPKPELESARPSFNATIQALGTYRLEPLFGK